VANILQNMCRTEDIVARFGGEEFIMILSNCDLDNAIKKAESIRQAIEESNPEGLTVTSSIGAAELADDDKFETLFDRGYIKGKSIEATKLGISLIDSLEKHSPIIIDQKLTRDFERQMESIQTSKKELKSKSEKIVKDAEKNLKEIEKQFRKQEDKIGKELMDSVNHIRDKERQENTLTKCPKCGEGNLRIMYNKASKRYFIACSAYPKCMNTYTLPPYGLMKPSIVEIDREKTNEKCPECGFPLMLAIKKGKRPWKFCFNPECPTRKQQEEYKNNHQKENTNSEQ